MRAQVGICCFCLLCQSFAITVAPLLTTTPIPLVTTTPALVPVQGGTTPWIVNPVNQAIIGAGATAAAGLIAGGVIAGVVNHNNQLAPTGVRSASFRTQSAAPFSGGPLLSKQASGLRARVESADEGGNWLWILLGILCACCCMGLIGYLGYFQMSKKKRSLKTRSVKDVSHEGTETASPQHSHVAASPQHSYVAASPQHSYAAPASMTLQQMYYDPGQLSQQQLYFPFQQMQYPPGYGYSIVPSY